MDNIDHPLKIKPINEIIIILKDIRSDISQIKREILQLKNEIRKLNEDKKPVQSSGWFY